MGIKRNRRYAPGFPFAGIFFLVAYHARAERRLRERLRNWIAVSWNFFHHFLLNQLIIRQSHDGLNRAGNLGRLPERTRISGASRVTSPAQRDQATYWLLRSLRSQAWPTSSHFPSGSLSAGPGTGGRRETSPTVNVPPEVSPRPDLLSRQLGHPAAELPLKWHKPLQNRMCLRASYAANCLGGTAQVTIISGLLSQSLCQAGRCPGTALQCAGFSKSHGPPAERGITMCSYESFNQLSPALPGPYTV